MQLGSHFVVVFRPFVSYWDSPQRYPCFYPTEVLNLTTEYSSTLKVCVPNTGVLIQYAWLYRLLRVLSNHEPRFKNTALRPIVILSNVNGEFLNGTI